MDNFDKSGPQGFAADLVTPAFVYDLATVAATLARLQPLRAESGLRVLYSMKACPVVALLRALRGHVDGLSASSVYEARLAREALGTGGTVQIATPGLADTDLPSAVAVCDAVVFNSLPQWQRLRPRLPETVQAGLRINPGVSLVPDQRYDPCRPHSKLGVTLAALQAAVAADPALLAGLHGLHWHTHCEATDYRPLLATAEQIIARLPALVRRVRWVNLGGGYLLPEGVDLAPLAEAIARLRALNPGLEVHIEPGKGVVSAAGTAISRVIDLFDSDGLAVAILDTSINHQPEVFEYARRPLVAEAEAAGPYRYLLAGGTCLAGDLFGEFCFGKPLALGSQITFKDVGAYALVKAQRFNGHNLPSVWLRHHSGHMQRVCEPGYDDYRALWGGDARDLAAAGPG